MVASSCASSSPSCFPLLIASFATQFQHLFLPRLPPLVLFLNALHHPHTSFHYYLVQHSLSLLQELLFVASKSCSPTCLLSDFLYVSIHPFDLTASDVCKTVFLGLWAVDQQDSTCHQTVFASANAVLHSSIDANFRRWLCSRTPTSSPFI